MVCPNSKLNLIEMKKGKIEGELLENMREINKKNKIRNAWLSPLALGSR